MKTSFIALLISVPIVLSAHEQPFPAYLLHKGALNPDFVQSAEVGWHLYSGGEYSFLIQDENYRVDDFSFTSGIFLQRDTYFFNTAWNGTTLKWLFTMEGFDAVFEEGDREICSDTFFNGFQVDFLSPYLAAHLNVVENNPFYRVAIRTPDLLGLYSGILLEERPITLFQLDLVKTYQLSGVFSTRRVFPFLGWKNSLLSIEIGYDATSFSFRNVPTLDNPLEIDLNGKSDTGYSGTVRVDRGDFHLDSSFSASYSQLHGSGSSDTTQFFYLENESDRDGFIPLYLREAATHLRLFDSRFQVQVYHALLLIPEGGNNRGLVDMAPLSPVGVLYRRKDILENGALTYRQTGGAVGGRWGRGRLSIEGHLYASHVSLLLSGTYHYIDGIISLLPVPHWTESTTHDQREIEIDRRYLILEPHVAVSVIVGRCTLETAVRQAVPLMLFHGTERSASVIVSDAVQRRIGSSRRGGFNASLQLSYRL